MIVDQNTAVVQEEAKKSYTTPQLTLFGAVEELTQQPGYNGTGQP
jgi:hypothetical protein